MIEFILQPEVFQVLINVLATLIIVLVGWKGYKYITHGLLVFKVWHLVEKTGALKEWKGYEKLAVAMDVLSEKFHDQFGREPKPGEEGRAVTILTWLCKLEDKGDSGEKTMIDMENLPENS